jgi:bacterioferritin
MKGNDQVLAELNTMLADELTAINQYIVHAEMCENWGYEELDEVVTQRAITEMKHAERLINRILFLDGQPMVSTLNPIHIGSDVGAQLKNDLAAELGAVKGYNAGIRLAADAGDNGTRELFESILGEEEEHVDWLEAQLTQIEQMGIQNYLVEQLG